MSEFDHESAWHELARLAFDSLPANIRETVNIVEMYASDCVQDRDCDLAWPTEEQMCKGPLIMTPEQFRTRFEKLDAKWLSQAARVVYFYGHWMPGPVDGARRYEDGATWRFANYADQVLRKRLKMTKPGPDQRLRSGAVLRQDGLSFEVHQGMLRACWTTSQSWLWREFAWATPTVYKKAVEFNTFDETDGMSNILIETFADENAKLWLDTGKWMVENGTWASRRETERQRKADAKYDVEKVAGAVNGIRSVLVGRAADSAVHSLACELGVSKEYMARVETLAKEES